ncbi:MAG: chemotaxis protein [Bacteroidota bacterium]|jgi:two-component system CheB/CheR fusion protein|nr:chemotaxis protein [Bacteroidota bacterium]
MTVKRNAPGKTTKEKMFVVGIGASAGGLEAIHELFDNMPDDTGYCFVIVQHLSPDYKSLMPELLAKHSQMKIFEAEDGMQLKRNCIYVIPSKFLLSLEGETIKLTDKDRKGAPNTAIDYFLTSLAKEKGKDAIAIILSGTGSDGTNGIEAIKANGGIVIVQDPISAKFDGMPNSAINTGFADLILSPDMIAGELIEFLMENQSPLQKTFQDMSQKDEYLLREILENIYKATGHDFSHYKRPTIHRRLSKRMAMKNIKSLNDYIQYMNRHQDEAKLLAKEFMIGVTKFFRDTEAFDELYNIVFPQLFADKKNGEAVKVWTIACSTGEEAYSLAILFQEYLNKHKLTNVIKIFATDIDEAALETASKGIYPDTITADISKDRLEKYFIKEGNTYRIAPTIRKMIVFANHNVLKDPPFSKVDLLTCRNMLIYLGNELQKNILRTIHFAMCPNGYLFMGPSENIGSLKDGMKELSKKWKLFKNISKPLMVTHEHYQPSVESKFNNPYATAIKTKNALNNLPEIFKETVMDEYKYAGILIDREFEVKQAIGNFKEYLKFPDGSFNLNILKLVSPELSIAISGAVRKATKESTRVVLKKVKLGEKETRKTVNIIVKPYLDQSEYIQPFIFVVIHEEEEKLSVRQKGQSSNMDKTSMLLEVEEELRETKENLQAAIEELETANEELQSSNEEMISANEELQSTNEELQSLNEELHTVNTEHQMKIRELVELNEDLNNYFSSTDIGQLLIDKKLIIRRFSPAVKKQVNLIETDIGRSILDISNNFQSLDFVNDLRTVMKKGNTIEKEISLKDNRVHLMRISPYIKLNRTIDGVVVTFIDISETKQLSSIIDSVFNSSVSGITVKKAIRDKNNVIVDFEYIAVNDAAVKMFMTTKEQLVGKRVFKNAPSSDQTYFDRYREVVDHDKVQHFEFFDDRNERWYEIIAMKMMDGLVTTFTDVTEKKKAAEELNKHYNELKKATKKLSYSNSALEQSNYDLLQFASVVSHDLKEPLRKIMTFGNLLQGTNQENRSDKEKGYLDKIVKSTERMKNLIDDLLSFSKLSNKNVKYTQTDLNDIIHAITEDLEVQIKEQNAEIIVQNIPQIEALSGQMHQLFQNLISNALKFSNGSKPKIVIEERAIPAEMSATLKILNPKDYTCICVEDNGIGFEPEYSEKIFGLFQRLPTTEKTPGTGIGLAICKKITENHKGFITATSEPGKGSQFYVILPKQQKLQKNPILEN